MSNAFFVRTLFSFEFVRKTVLVVPKFDTIHLPPQARKMFRMFRLITSSFVLVNLLLPPLDALWKEAERDWRRPRPPSFRLEGRGRQTPALGLVVVVLHRVEVPEEVIKEGFGRLGLENYS
jgi:hypothetical protein